MSEVIDAAVQDAEALVRGGCDALLVENMGDVPYLKGHVGPETVASAALAVHRVAEMGLPVGVQLLAAANREALGVALAAGASFIRVEGYAWAHVADEGWIDACAGELSRARAALGAEVAFWADCQKKHSAHAVTADLGVAELARGLAFCGADAVVITGRHTGSATALNDVEAAREAGLPVVVGSGVSPRDAGDLARVANALIVGSWFKEGGDWRRAVVAARVAELVRAVRGAT